MTDARSERAVDPELLRYYQELAQLQRREPSQADEEEPSSGPSRAERLDVLIWVETLPPSERAVTLAVFWGRLTVPELCDVFRRDRRTVLAMLGRALASLRSAAAAAAEG